MKTGISGAHLAASSLSRALCGVRLAALPLALIGAWPVLAQTSDASLGEVVVTASRNPQQVTAALAHTTVITRQDIEQSQAVDLMTLLQRETGLQATQSGGIGTVSTLFMRGLPAMNTLVLIDGIAQNRQDATGAVSLEHIMLDNVERVEIVRGNVSAIYGSGAIGGVIQIFTRTAGKEPSVSLSMEIGPRATAKVTGNASVSAGDTAIAAGVSRYTTEGFSSINTSQIVNANPDSDGYQNTSANLSLTHSITPRLRIGLQVQQSTGDSTYDSAIGIPGDLHSSTTNLNQTVLFVDNTWGSWRSRLNVSERTQRDMNRNIGSYTSDDGVNSLSDTVSWVNTFTLGDNIIATAGLENQKQHIDTTSTYDPYSNYDRDRNTRALFGGLEASFGAASFQFNARNDNVGDLQKTTGYLGAGYALTPAIKLNASSSTAFNAPPLGYLYYPYGGNPNLKPELAQSSEIGIQYTAGAQWLRLTYFDTRVQDQMVYDSTYNFANIAQTRTTGLEVSYRGKLYGADLNASMTLQDPVNELTNTTLQRRAKTMASLGVGQTFGALQAGANVRYVGARPDSATGTDFNLDEYTVLDLTLAYRYSPQLTFKARLDNAFDTRYQTVYGYNSQPSSLYVGVVWNPVR